MVYRSPYRRLRRMVYHALGGEGHHDPVVRVVDMFLIALITLNVLAAILESVPNLSMAHGPAFHVFDAASAGIFTVEYLLRLWTAVESPDRRFQRPVWGRIRFAFTPMALIDLIAILPFILDPLIDLREMRVVRLLRIFKLSRYSSAMGIMMAVLRQEARAIGAILFIMMVILVFMSSLMYLVEHKAQPEVFSDIPSTMWWAIVTMTTLGYGDMVPMTPGGRVLGGLTALIGIGMVALPSGVLASGFSEQLRLRREEYREQVAAALEDGALTRRERRSLDQTRRRLDLSEEEASLILEQAVRLRGQPCPHCGKVHPHTGLTLAGDGD